MPLTWASKCSSSGKYTAWWDILHVIYHSMQGSYLSRVYHLLVSLCSGDEGTQSRAGMFYSVLAVVWMFIFIATGWSFVSQLRHRPFQFLPQKDDCWGGHIPDPCCYVRKGWRIAQGAHFPPRHREDGCRLIVIHFKSQINIFCLWITFSNISTPRHNWHRRFWRSVIYWWQLSIWSEIQRLFNQAHW